MEVNACVKQLLSCFHGGYLWLDTKLPITVDLISYITGFHKEGIDPYQYFRGKDNDKKLDARLKNRYDVVHDKIAYIIRTFNEKKF